VKSISIVHTGYVVAINTTRSDLAFCNTMVLTYRATWAVLPWTVFVLSWILLLCNEEQTETTSQQSEKRTGVTTANIHLPTLGPLLSAGKCESSSSVKSGVTASNLSFQSNRNNSHERSLSICSNEDDDEEKLILNILKKYPILIIWIMAIYYALLSQYQNREKGFCELREEWLSKLGLISLFSVLVLPLALGPLFALFSFVGKTFLKSTARGRTREVTQNCICTGILTGLFVTLYSVNMIVAEWLYDDLSVMWFVLIKYSCGSLQNLLSPIAILLSYPEMRKYIKKKENKSK